MTWGHSQWNEINSSTEVEMLEISQPYWNCIRFWPPRWPPLLSVRFGWCHTHRATHGPTHRTHTHWTYTPHTRATACTHAHSSYNVRARTRRASHSSAGRALEVRIHAARCTCSLSRGAGWLPSMTSARCGTYDEGRSGVRQRRWCDVVLGPRWAVPECSH